MFTKKLLVFLAVFLLASPVLAQTNKSSPAPPPGWAGPAWPCPRWQAWQGVKTSTIKGKVVSILFPLATIETGKHQTYVVRLGPWWFWRNMGYSLQQGEKVTVEGYVYQNYIIPVVIRTPSGEIRLRDQYGWPLWRGGPGWWRRRGWGRGPWWRGSWGPGRGYGPPWAYPGGGPWGPPPGW